MNTFGSILISLFIFVSCGTEDLGRFSTPIPPPDTPKDTLRDLFEQMTCCQYWNAERLEIVTCVTTDGSCRMCDSICARNPAP
jgi:hypothetical protein